MFEVEKVKIKSRNFLLSFFLLNFFFKCQTLGRNIYYFFLLQTVNSCFCYWLNDACPWKRNTSLKIYISLSIKYPSKVNNTRPSVQN